MKTIRTINQLLRYLGELFEKFEQIELTIYRLFRIGSEEIESSESHLFRYRHYHAEYRTGRSNPMTITIDEERDEVAGQLRDIQQQILELLGEAEGVLERSDFGGARSRAQAYWLAHAKIAITNDHSYLGGSMCSLQDTIAEIENSDEEDGCYDVGDE